MNNEVSKTSIKKTEQRILRRVLEIYVGVTYRSEVEIYNDDEWQDILGNRYDDKVSLKYLIKNGWKVMGISQSFAPRGDQSYIYGVETVIIEREYYE